MADRVERLRLLVQLLLGFGVPIEAYLLVDKHSQDAADRAFRLEEAKFGHARDMDDLGLQAERERIARETVDDYLSVDEDDVYRRRGKLEAMRIAFHDTAAFERWLENEEHKLNERRAVQEEALSQAIIQRKSGKLSGEKLEEITKRESRLERNLYGPPRACTGFMGSEGISGWSFDDVQSAASCVDLCRKQPGCRYYSWGSSKRVKVPDDD